MKQATALSILQAGHNVFLTGSAGSGKTYLLNQYISQLRAHGVPIAITASTGIAATHIGGQTIHSWSGIGIKDELSQVDLERIAKKKPVRERIEKVKVLIIDEISMLSRQFLTNLNHVLKYIRLSQEAFGGVQIVLCGDFFQLPPVSRQRLPNHLKFAFMAPAWVEAKLKICYLTQQFRQNEDDLADFLNEMRAGDLSDSRTNQLQECIERTHDTVPEVTPTRLYTHNADVDAINLRELQKLKTPAHLFTGKAMGTKQLVESLKKSILAHEKLVLKVGAEVIFVKNMPEHGYYNGTMGTVTSLTDEGLPVVTTRDDKQITVKPVEWRISDISGAAVASFAQIPLRLAWAITVHKSQGMTLDMAEMDLSKTFEPGQGYVALSRVKGWHGLRLLGCNNNALQLDPLVRKADARFRELSAEIDQGEPITEKEFEARIRAMGGTVDTQKMKALAEKNAEAVVAKPKAKKVSTYLLTKQLAEAKKTLTEMMTARSMSEETILKHLLHLREKHPDLDLVYLRPPKVAMAKMAMGFALAKTKAGPADRDKDGHPKLRFIFELLKEQFTYRELKRAQLFL